MTALADAEHADQAPTHQHGPEHRHGNTRTARLGCRRAMVQAQLDHGRIVADDLTRRVIAICAHHGETIICLPEIDGRPCGHHDFLNPVKHALVEHRGAANEGYLLRECAELVQTRVRVPVEPALHCGFDAMVKHLKHDGQTDSSGEGDCHTLPRTNGKIVLHEPFSDPEEQEYRRHRGQVHERAQHPPVDAA